MTNSHSDITSCLCSLMLILAICITSGCDQEPAPDPINKDLPLQVQDSTDHYIYEVRFPAAIRYNDMLRRELQGYAQSQRTDFISFFQQDSIPDGPIYPWQLSLDFTVFDSTKRFTSILGQGYTYTGGAHGNHFYKTVNYDNSGKHFIRLTDLFADSTALHPVSEYSRKKIVSELTQRISVLTDSADSTQELSMSSLGWINDGTAPDFPFFQHFLLARPGPNGHPTGLQIFFPPYQVAAYAAGSFDIFVPESVFKDQLTPKGRKLFQQ
ncbi:DUF3298 and DUF4163 domain-containing protein [Fodinibius salsisoli]|uniref:DUF3298 and DUF4163 domain-containing protein n=1 Tax=Fodinibius salsisoli TaxID=2820877 RepID=A0ABT3PM36_9BACT|nr:DUF3298 and DUF4163 domain-containing protein [Fodinibius salsisoli]MCW9707016.1 DUF3298 and DUF4163 domain-containing protein [Fodinibius salsisoli]